MKLGSWKYYLLLILAMVFWGGSWVSVKIVVSNAPPLTVGFFRFLIASIIFIPILLTTNREKIQSYTRRDLGLFFVLGFVGVLGYGIFFLVGMQFTTSAQGSIIAGVNPITVSLLAFLFLNERLAPKWRYLGFLFSFLGIFFVVGVQSFLEFRLDYLIGNLILLIGMLTWGLYTVLGKKVITLIDDQLAADSYEVKWNGFNTNGSEVASGVYIYVLRNEYFTASRKMILLR